MPNKFNRKQPDTGGIRNLLENPYWAIAASCKMILVQRFIVELFVVTAHHGRASFREQQRPTHRDHTYHTNLADFWSLSVLRWLGRLTLLGIMCGL